MGTAIGNDEEPLGMASRLRLRAAIVESIPSSIQDWTIIALGSILYAGLGQICLQATSIVPGICLIWYPSGLAAGLMFRFGLRLWMIVPFGITLVWALNDVPAEALATGILAQSIEALIAAWSLSIYTDGKRIIAAPSLGTGLRFLLIGCGLAPCISALIGTYAVVSPGQWSDLVEPFFAWWIGDSLGILQLMPLVAFIGHGGGWAAVKRQFPGHFLPYLIGHMAVAYFAIFLLPEAFPNINVLHFPFLSAVFIAVRYRFLGAAASTLAIGIFMIASSLSGIGAITATSGHDLTSSLSAAAGMSCMALLVGGAMCNASRRILALEQADEVQQAVSNILRLSVLDKPLRGKLHEALRLIVDISWLSHLPKAGIFLNGPSPGAPIEMAAHVGFPPSVVDGCSKVALGTCLCGRVAMTGKPFHASCIDHDHEVVYDDMEPHGHYVIPIKRNAAVIGILTLYLPHGHQQNPRELDAMEALAEALSSLIEKSRTDEAQRLSEQKFKDAAEISSDWFWETDNALRITTGLGSEPLGPGRAYFSKLPLPEWGAAKTSQNTWVSFVETLRQRQAFRNFEYLFLDAEGNTVCWSISGKPAYDDRGQFIGYRGTTSDVTQMKRHEDDLIQAVRAADAANLAKINFLAQMSHELRTPLNAILGYAELIHIRNETVEPKRIVDWADRIHMAGDILLGHVEDILDAAAINTGKRSLARNDIPVRPMMDEIIKQTKILIREKKINLALAENATFTVTGDDKAIRQIITNLIENAIKYSPAASTLDLGLFPGESEGHPGLGIIEICDEGPGIPEEHMAKAKEMFIRVGDPEVAQTTAGTGLGLSIANELAERMGGRIDLHNRRKGGLCARVFLPLSGT